MLLPPPGIGGGEVGKEFFRRVADAVFAPLYWGYGREGEYADRRVMVRHYDEEVLHLMPDTILVLIKVSADTIRQRMRAGESPFPDRHQATLFQEEFDSSLITRRFEIDTTDATVGESLQEFVRKVEPLITPEDRKRIEAAAG